MSASTLSFFDCDGVLVDSEVISCRAHGGNPDASRLPHHIGTGVGTFLGVSDAKRARHRNRTRPQASDDFETQMKQAALRRYADDLRPIPHVGEAMPRLTCEMRGVERHARENRHGLTCAGIYDRLAPHIFSASQVKRGKPAPDLFCSPPGRCGHRPNDVW